MEFSDMSADGDRALPVVECMGLADMSVDGDRALPPPPTVAVAVKGRGGNGSRRTVRWAAENLMPIAGRFVLVHVMPKITSIRTPSGDVPVELLGPHVVEMYRQIKSDEIFIPLKKLCKRLVVETLVLEDDNPASALLKYVADSGVSSLVLGSSSFIRILPNFMVRKLKDTVPSVVLKKVPEDCNIYIVSKRRLITTSATPWSTCEDSSINWWCGRGGSSSLRFYKLNSSHYSSSMDSEDTDTASSVSDLNHLDVLEILQWRYPHHFGPLPRRIYYKLTNGMQENEGGNERLSVPSTDTEQSNVYAEVEQLRGELMNAFGMYNQACVNLVHIEDKVHKLSSDCLNEARQVNAAMQNVEIYNKIADEEKTKHLEAVKEIEMARKQLAKEGHERHIAEMKAHEDSMEKKKIIEALFLNDRRYRRYTKDEIEIATDSFSETKIIGEGSYGKVYRCDLDKTPVAIKVLHSDASEKKEEFLTEDWPLVEAEKMGQMALKCLEARCRDRPDLETEVLPLLKELADIADAALRARANNIHPPNHYFCPILEEVMEDPYIAADGYTYEHRAIKTWLERYPLSPVTRDRLQHTELIQNHTLRSAIQEWRSCITPSSG